MSDYHEFDENAVEEDGDEVFTPIPEICVIWNCGGKVRPHKGFHICEKCSTSYGKVRKLGGEMMPNKITASRLKEIVADAKFIQTYDQHLMQAMARALLEARPLLQESLGLLGYLYSDPQLLPTGKDKINDAMHKIEAWLRGVPVT